MFAPSDSPGSSPHTRGTQAAARRKTTANRFIPAYAGNAAGQLSVSKVCTVHPRIRGERARDRISGEREDGSSPHTRGTLKNLGGFEEAARFIPAYAGNAAGVAHALGGAQVHPRIRGERATAHSAAIFNAGSSPHTRGTPQVPGHRPARHRFIPAYAGNAGRRYGQAPCRPVHPRIRGERWTSSFCPRKAAGSSPHTRGTQFLQHRVFFKQRFIPAYAGNAPGSSASAGRSAVHPRIRGEREYVRGMADAGVGSSPHTRGTHGQDAGQYEFERFIPAYAGNAFSQEKQQFERAVHPRIRGERRNPPPTHRHVFGSSPHTRGTRAAFVFAHGAARFIPAYAGNARRCSFPARSAPVHPRIRGERTSNKLLIYQGKIAPSDSTKHSAC